MLEEANLTFTTSSKEAKVRQQPGELKKRWPSCNVNLD